MFYTIVYIHFHDFCDYRLYSQVKTVFTTLHAYGYLKILFFDKNASYCILRGRIKGFNHSITTILCQVGSYRTVVG